MSFFTGSTITSFVKAKEGRFVVRLMALRRRSVRGYVEDLTYVAICCVGSYRH